MTSFRRMIFGDACTASNKYNFYCSTHLHLKVYIWIFMSKTHNYSFSFQHCDIIIHPFLFALVILCAYPFKWLDKLLLH